MLIAEAHVETGQPSRYLVQLCRHFNHKAEAHPDVQAQIEWSDDRGFASFGWGLCTIRADPGILTLRAEAEDEANLQRVELLVADHLERLGKRDHLTVTWTPAMEVGEQPPSQPSRPREDNPHG